MTGATAVDTLPSDVTLVTPLDATLTESAGTLTWAIPDIAVGASVSVSYSVTVDESAAGKTLDNVVVPGHGGECVTPDDCITHHPVKQIIPTTLNSCELDAAYLTYSFTTVNLPNANQLPVTITWRTQDNTVARVDTIPAGQTSGRLLWPGMVLNGDGIAIQWPGWRKAEQGEVPQYADMLLDPSLPSYAYRLPMTVTFEINPHATVDVQYPDVTPAGCAVPRVPDLDIVKTASTDVVEGGSEFTYAVNVRNTSTLGTAYPVTLTDPISSDIAITDITTSTTASPKWNDCAITGADADGFGGTLTCALSGYLAAGAAAPEVVLHAKVLPTTTASEIPNTAEVCWQNPSETNSPVTCKHSTVKVKVKQIIPNAVNACLNDAAYLAYDIKTVNLPNASTLPVTVTWRAQDGSVARVDTIPAGQTKGVLLWPGMVLDANGVSIGYPGWRVALPGETPQFLNQLLDPSLPSYQWRLPMQVTFSINPSATVTVTYPGVSPAGCAVPRIPNLVITKDANVTTVVGGQTFAYSINVANTVLDAAAYPVTLSDPIPADIAVTGITTSTTAFPKWVDCAVTGTDAGGYGGTLNCHLDGVLGPHASAPLVELAALVRTTAPAGDITNTAQVCWNNPDAATNPAPDAMETKCASDNAVVTVPGAPPLAYTGLDAGGLIWAALLLLVGGGVFLALGKRRPHLPRLPRRLH